MPRGVNAPERRGRADLPRSAATGLLFEVEDVVRARPVRSVPAPVVTASEDDLTRVAWVALWGPLLDRLNVVDEADQRGLREIGPTGYSVSATRR
jgi:hypothetical protein